MLMSGSALAKTLKKTRGRAVEIYLQKAVTNANVSPSDFRFREFSVFFLSFFNTRGVFNTLVTNTRSEERARAARERRDQPVNVHGLHSYRTEVYSSITKVHAQMHSIKTCP